MKNIFFSFFAFLLLLAGCKKETDPVFEQTAEERISARLQAHQAALTGAPNGWKGVVYPAGGGAYSFYFKFNNQNGVQMLSDFKAEFAGQVRESTYRLKGLQKPSLIFDTYSYIHVLADPVDTVNGGTLGQGLNSDFEFSIENEQIGDTVYLKGLAKGSEAFLVKATAAESDSAFNKARLRTILTATEQYLDDNAFLYLSGSGNIRVATGFDTEKKVMTFSYLDGNGNLINLETPFSYTVKGILLKSPVTVGGYTFQELLWDPVRRVYYFLNGNSRVELANSTSPILPFFKLIGSRYPYVFLLPDEVLPGQSTLFTTNFKAVQDSLENGRFGLTLYYLSFDFDAATRTMTVNAPVIQNGGLFAVQYYYSYTLDNAGVAKFTRQGSNGNGSLVAADFKGILDYIDSDRFQLDYFVDGPDVYGQLKSIEHPAFFFTGYLQ